MDEILISVIVPIYNVMYYVEKCIKSIIKQTYSNLEIILVDDGSTDDSGKICEYYSKKDKRIKVFHTENRGLVAARKLGLKHSTGEYIGFVDADDYIDEDMYEVLLNEIVYHDADFIHTGYIAEYADKTEKIFGMEDGIFEFEDIQQRENFLIKYLFKIENENFVSYSIWSKLYKARFIKNNYFLLKDDQQYGEDLLSLCFCILEGRKIILRKKAFYHYVVKENSMSHVSNTRYIMKEIELFGNIIRNLMNYNQKIYLDLEKDISFFFKNKFLEIIQKTDKEIIIPYFYYDDIKPLSGKRIIIYGAGVVGRDYYIQFCKYRDIDIIAWVDSNWEKCQCEYMDIMSPDTISDYRFDKIIIAVKDEKIASDIKNKLLDEGQMLDKIIWNEPKYILNS